MPLGIKQNNNLLCLTLDVWQDLVFLNEQAAGQFHNCPVNIYSFGPN